MDAYENVGLYCDGEATLREQGCQVVWKNFWTLAKHISEEFKFLKNS